MRKKTNRTTSRDLYRYVYNLNIKHNTDRGDAGYAQVVPHYSGHRNLFHCEVTSGIGQVIITSWGSPREVIDELRGKNWRTILAVAKAQQLTGTDNGNAETISTPQ